ncbi:hypothetical protein CHS0354_008213 [Potamilus streckersoni]|uniref:Deacetylase sirtuin-type domain-containing protein n=1 Tax=Potamilus streckersoni TaxID=2493646 RepID=A0AAE0RWN4_9BIVA|nr:hypothetical protein CHS0354_008213 [Potamilus streckersoni]
MMRLSCIMAAVRKGKPNLERVPSAGPKGRQPRANIHILHPNSSPVYKTKSETQLLDATRNLRLNDQRTKRTLFSKGNGSGKTSVKSLTDVANLIKEDLVQNIVVVAGAGISTSSGIPDFRSPGTGLYDNLQQYRIPYPEAIFDIDFFCRNPRPFFTLAKELYPTGKYRPNYIHYFIKLLHDRNKLLRMYTQNIDGLERWAGIPDEKLVEAHGTFSSATCTVCGAKQKSEDVKESIFADKIPKCKIRGCTGIVKPDIVFFGEDLPHQFYCYMKDMLQTDLVLVMGTSLEVQPFAGIIDNVRYNVPRVLFNMTAVGPFRYSKRSQDVVAEGDLIESIQKFSCMIGWKTDMIELITQKEGSFKISSVMVSKNAGVPKTTNNYTNSFHRENAFVGSRGNVYESSTSESDSESDVTSSDSSVDETSNSKSRRKENNVRKGVNLSTRRNGASTQHNKQSGRGGGLIKHSLKKKDVEKEKNAKSKTRNTNGVLSNSSVVAKKEKDLDDKNSKDVLSVTIKNGKTEMTENIDKAEKVEDGSLDLADLSKLEISSEDRSRVLKKYGLTTQKTDIQEADKDADSETSQTTVIETKGTEKDGVITTNSRLKNSPEKNGANVKGKNGNDKPRTGQNIQPKRELHILNTRAYGYAIVSRNKTGRKPSRPVVPTLNSYMDYKYQIFERSSSAETPKIAYRHRLQAVKYDARIFGPLVQESSSELSDGDSSSDDITD